MTDKEILDKAIARAVECGWKNTVGYTVIDIMGTAMLHQEAVPPHILNDPIELIFNHEFARALWGSEQVDNHGHDIKSIRIWANQVAVKHAGKLYEVNPEKQFVTMLRYPELSTFDLQSPESVVNVERVEYELKRMTGEIPFETFKLHPLEVEVDSLPAYKHHLREMATLEDPIRYLELEAQLRDW